MQTKCTFALGSAIAVAGHSSSVDWPYRQMVPIITTDKSSKNLPNCQNKVDIKVSTLPTGNPTAKHVFAQLLQISIHNIQCSVAMDTVCIRKSAWNH